MKNLSIACLAALAAVSFCACKDLSIKQAVEQEVELKLDSKQAAPAADGSVVYKGAVDFTHSYYETRYRTECDSYVCGYEQSESCTPVERCSGGGDSCTTVQRCTGSGCTDDTVCHSTPQSCYTDTVCSTQSIPQYCETNCREVPYESLETDHVYSPVTAVVRGVSSADKKAKIEKILLGMKTSDAFRGMFDNPSSRPKGSEELFKNLTRDDKTLVVVQAKGYAVSSRQSFVKIPADFKKGDALAVELSLESTGDNKSHVSGSGSAETISIPLHTGK